MKGCDITDDIIADLGYVWSDRLYDDANEPRTRYKNRVKIAAAHMGKLAAEHIDEPIEEVMNYDR